jgi:hypothetical protein
VRGDKVYYLNAFPGKPFEIDDADTDAFQAVDTTHSEVPDADPAAFESLDRPGFLRTCTGWARPSTAPIRPSFRVVNAAFEWSAHAHRAYYRQTAIAGADPHSFLADRSVATCDETYISFAD